MGTSVGPFDGRRARRTRCQACAKRKIKCAGGAPCDYCKRTQQPCVFSARRPAALVFVGHGQGPKAQPVIHLDRNLTYFFDYFLAMNSFSRNNASWQKELQLFLHRSPALSSAVSAIAALYRCRHERLLLDTTQVRQDRLQALQSYTQAVKLVRAAITSNTLADPVMLWSTFFLALFELMRDSSGTDWLSHFLNGTCAILRLQSPENLLLANPAASHTRNFFFTTRIFEIARALIYSQPTFLSGPDWTHALSQWWSCEEGQRLWHPKEALFDKLPHFCDLSIRTLHFAKTGELDLDSRLHHAETQMLADEGIVLQQWLQQWWVSTELYERKTTEAETDFLVAKNYYHAISIYLSGSYDYHSHWSKPNSPQAPILSRLSIEGHMHEILRLSQELLDRGVAGLLLFIPLRIAGARVSKAQEQDLILQLLRTISERGYAVASAIHVDLIELWERRINKS